jgi:uncharacterized membrane protein
MAQPPSSARTNIETVARMEQEFLKQRTFTDRLGDSIADLVGTMKFVLFHVVGIAAWAAVNAGVVPGVRPFDPYPYTLLTMLVSMEGVLVSVFVLMKQNRMSRRADHRDHLNLQIDLLSEKEITKMLQLQRAVCERLGIKVDDAEVQELSKHTAVEDLAQELEQKLPGA